MAPRIEEKKIRQSNGLFHYALCLTVTLTEITTCILKWFLVNKELLVLWSRWGHYEGAIHFTGAETRVRSPGWGDGFWEDRGHSASPGRPPEDAWQPTASVSKAMLAENTTRWREECRSARDWRAPGATHQWDPGFFFLPHGSQTRCQRGQQTGDIVRKVTDAEGSPHTILLSLGKEPGKEKSSKTGKHLDSNYGTPAKHPPCGPTPTASSQGWDPHPSWWSPAPPCPAQGSLNCPPSPEEKGALLSVKWNTCVPSSAQQRAGEVPSLPPKRLLIPKTSRLQ